MRRALGWLLVAVALVLPPAAEAARAGASKVAVLRPEGRQGEALRKVLVQTLGKKKGREVLAPRAVDTQARQEPRTDAERQALAERLGAAALLTASVTEGRRWDVQVRVYSGADGGLLTEERWRVRPHRGFPDVRRTLEQRLGGALQRARDAFEAQARAPRADTVPPAPISPAPAASTAPPPVSAAPPPAAVPPPLAAASLEAAEEVAEDTEGAVHTAAEPALEVVLSAEGFMRRLGFNDDLFEALPTYALNRAVAASLSVGWYPGAHFSQGALRHVGVVARGSRALGLSSVGEDGTRYATTVQAVEAGLRVRLPPRWAELSVGALYGAHLFAVELEPSAALSLPDVDYRFVHAELGLRKALSPRWALAARVGYQHLLSSGELDSAAFFPRLSGAAVDGELAVEFGLTRSLGLRVGAEYRRYFFSFRPEVGDPLIAGGALDQYLSGKMGLSLRL